MPGELVHFDIPVEDVERMADFYRNVMGWKIEPYGQEFGGYLMIDPAPDKDPEMAVKGGMARKEMPGQVPMNYYRTDNLEKFNQRVPLGRIGRGLLSQSSGAGEGRRGVGPR